MGHVVQIFFFFFSRYLDRIIRRVDLQEFESMLLPHQKAITADGQWAFVIVHTLARTYVFMYTCKHTCT